MANRRDKFYRNVPGKYYVDCTCTDHDCCIHAAPENFRRDENRGAYYVCKQPENPEQERQMQQAIHDCPVGAVGDDGELPDSEYWLDPEYPPRTADPAVGRNWLLYREGGNHTYDLGFRKCMIETDAAGVFTRFDRAAASFFKYYGGDAVGKLHYSAFHDPDEMKACSNDPSFKARMENPGFTEDVWKIVPGEVLAERFSACVTLLPLRGGSGDGAITGFVALYRRVFVEE